MTQINEEFTPDVNLLKAIHKDYASLKKQDSESLLRKNNSMSRVQVSAKTMGEAGGKGTVIARLLFNNHNEKHVDHYFNMKPKDKKALEEGYEYMSSGFEDFKTVVMESFASATTKSSLNESALKFKVAAKKTEKEMDWDEAQEYVKTLGKGWRLPTIDELLQIYQSDNDFATGGFRDGYWSSTEYATGQFWKMYFNDGGQLHSSRGSDALVRAVKG